MFNIYFVLLTFQIKKKNKILKIVKKDIIKKGEEFEQRKHVFKTTSERIKASREVKELILSINDIYKQEKDPELMDLMKRLTVVKQKIEKRLKGRPLTS